jgi:hypothetical protein
MVDDAVSDPKIVTLYESNFRDPVATLRAIADGVEAGKYGDVASVGIVVLGNTMEVFGGGEDNELCSLAVLFHAAFMRLCGFVESHGRGEG